MERRRWYEGSNDPLDQRKIQHGDWVRDKPIERKSDENGREPAVIEASAVPDSTDPLDVLIACEELDEAEGCECGTHLAEYCKSHKIPSQPKE
jgi:hypothetical protein